MSEQALREAGNFTICRSSAWASRMITSAWWVESHQVSKQAPTGEYLTVGSFMVRGKKNYLPPAQLEMGLGVLFRFSEDDVDAVARHKNERRDFALLQLEEEDADEMSKIMVSEKDEFAKKNNDDANDSRTDQTTLPGGQLPIPKAVSAEKISSVVSDDDEEEGVGVNTNGVDSLTEDDDKDEKKNVIETPQKQDCEKPLEEKPKEKKRGISKRDRKLIKKYGSLEEAEHVLSIAGKNQEHQQETVVDEDASTDQLTPAPSSNVAFGGQPTGKMKRGKKAKMKRAMKKYSDQDEEDRELAMMALQGQKDKSNRKKGSRNSQQGPATEIQRKVATETTAMLVRDSAIVAEKLNESVRSILAQCVTTVQDGAVKWDKLDADTLEQLLDLKPLEAQEAVVTRLLALKQTTRVDNFSASLGGILRMVKKYGYENLKNQNEDNEQQGDKNKRKTKTDKNAESQRWKQTMAEEGLHIHQDDDDNVDDTVELNKLTGNPHAQDLLLAAVPVCAPYSTLTKYAFRIKLTPGSMKRGKAAKQCLEMLLKVAASTKGAPNSSNEQLKNLIKQVGDNDWVQVLCSDVKISAPGASKQKHKGSNKQKKKKK